MVENKHSAMTRSSLEIDVKPSRNIRRNPRLVRATLSSLMLALVVALSACSASTSTPNSQATAPAVIAPQQTVLPTQSFTPTATSLPQPTATSAPQQPLANTSLDPCLLIDSQEASSIAGTTFGQGVEGTTPGGLKSCTYGSQTQNVFTVDVAQAPDVNTAKADKDQFLSDLQASAQQLSDQGLKVTQVPNFADGAVIATANISSGGITVNGGAIGFLKGTIFFGFSDLVIGGPAPSTSALQSEAATVLSKLP